MRKLYLILSLLTLATLGSLFAELANSQNTPAVPMGRLTAPGNTRAYTSRIAANKHTVHFVTTGTPSACTMRLEGTLDDPETGASWDDLSGVQDCSVSTAFHVVERPVTTVRVVLLTLTGGTAPAVTIKYLGVQ